MGKRQDYVELGSLGYGAAAELFQGELERVIKNVADPNTDAKKKRKITMVVTFTPNDGRNMCAVDIACDSKLAPVKPFETQMYVGVDGSGNALASEVKPPEQQSLFDDGMTVANDEGERVNVRTGEVVDLAANRLAANR